jgi:hypothetical protein
MCLRCLQSIPQAKFEAKKGSDERLRHPLTRLGAAHPAMTRSCVAGLHLNLPATFSCRYLSTPSYKRSIHHRFASAANFLMDDIMYPDGASPTY